MATRKKAAGATAAPVDVPGVLLSSENNKVLGRAKAALAKKWSLTKGDTLFDAVYVAWFHVALGRSDEARELCDHVAETVVFSGDHNVWSPASGLIALSARLARLAGDEARQATLIARLVETPAVAAMPREAFLKWIAEADKDIRSAEVDPSQKWACQGFARGCARAAYFRETAAAIPYDPGTVDPEALERTIATGLDGLRAHLAR